MGISFKYFSVLTIFLTLSLSAKAFSEEQGCSGNDGLWEAKFNAVKTNNLPLLIHGKIGFAKAYTTNKRYFIVHRDGGFEFVPFSAVLDEQGNISEFLIEQNYTFEAFSNVSINVEGFFARDNYHGTGMLFDVDRNVTCHDIHNATALSRYIENLRKN